MYGGDLDQLFWKRNWGDLNYANPGGLYLPFSQVDNAYWVWSFQGKLLQKCDRERFCQALWRPRPPTLLTEDKLKVGHVSRFCVYAEYACGHTFT